MARNLLVINCDLRETRVALIEDGVIAELIIERAGARGTVGNIVLGKVTRVLPGMQAAFIDVGLERAAFLHVEDLIRPDDFEAYLTGDAREDETGGVQRGEGGRRAHGHAHDEDGDEDEDEDELVAATSGEPAPPSPADDDDDDLASTEADEEGADPNGEDEAPDSQEPETDDAAEPDDAEAEELAAAEPVIVSAVARRVRRVLKPRPTAVRAEASEAQGEVAVEAGDGEAAGAERRADADDEPDSDSPVGAREEAATADDADEAADDDEGEGPDSDEELEVAPGPEAAEGAPNATASAEDRGSRRRRRRRRRGKDDKPAPAAAAPAPPAKAKGGEPRRDGGGNAKKNARDDKKKGGGSSRVARTVPITEVVKEGDQVIVQISKEPIGTKGARVTSHVSLPGRYVVYLPTVDHVGISKRIGNAPERQRLRKVMEALKPKTGGLIVRTVAEGLTKKNLKADIGYLIKLWGDVAKNKETAKAPAVLYGELDVVLRIARDLFTPEIEKIVIDDKETYGRLVRFVEMFLPERVKDIELYQGYEPIFDAYGIEDEIGRALSRKVPLPSGGYLVIDQAEALAAIDVNTGRNVGKGNRDLEETAFKTNLEAVEEIAYQLRFRNIGGLVILDLIDMESGGNREKVYRKLEALLAKDKAKTTINRISELGLIEMTRKRTRESLTRVMHEPCLYCDGTGQIQSRTTIAYEILRQIRRERATLPGYVVLVNAHPAVVDLMQGEERAAVTEAEKRYMRRIELVPHREYHIEQFDLQGK